MLFHVSLIMEWLSSAMRLFVYCSNQTIRKEGRCFSGIFKMKENIASSILLLDLFKPDLNLFGFWISILIGITSLIKLYKRHFGITIETEPLQNVVQENICFCEHIFMSRILIKIAKNRGVFVQEIKYTLSFTNLFLPWKIDTLFIIFIVGRSERFGIWIC